MGKATVYCENCGIRITTEEFETGEALTYENKNFCGECAAPIREQARDEGTSPDEISESGIHRALDLDDDKEASGRKQKSSKPGSKKNKRNTSRRRPRSRSRKGPSSSSSRHAAEDRRKGSSARHTRVKEKEQTGLGKKYGLTVFVLLLIAGGAGIYFFLLQKTPSQKTTDQKIGEIQKIMDEEIGVFEKDDVTRMAKLLKEARTSSGGDYRQDRLSNLENQIDFIRKQIAGRKQTRQRFKALSKQIKNGPPEKIKDLLPQLADLEEPAKQYELGEEFTYQLGELIKTGARRWRDHKLKEITKLDTSSYDTFFSTHQAFLEQHEKLMKSLENGISVNIHEVSSVPKKFWTNKFPRDARRVKWQFESDVKNFVDKQFIKLNNKLEPFYEKVNGLEEEGNFQQAIKLLNNPPEDIRQILNPFLQQLDPGHQVYKRANRKKKKVMENIQKRIQSLQNKLAKKQRGEEAEQKPQYKGRKVVLFKPGKGTGEMIWKKVTSGNLTLNENGNIVIRDKQGRSKQEKPTHYLFMGKKDWKNYVVEISLERINIGAITFFFRSDKNGNGAKFNARMQQKQGVLTLKMEGGNIYRRTPSGSWTNIAKDSGKNPQTERKSGFFGISLVGKGSITIKRVTAYVQKN